MTTARITTICALSATILIAASSAKAETVVGEYLGTLRNTTSSQAGYWMAKYLGGQNIPDNPSRPNGTAKPDENYNWSAYRNYNSDGTINSSGYKNAVGLTNQQVSNIPAWNTNLDWITADQTGAYSGTAYGANGYYSYVTTIEDVFSSSNSQSVSFNGLQISFAADDHLQAIIINGVLYEGFQAQSTDYPGWIQDYTNIVLSDTDWNVGGINTIEFIVHNNNSNANGDWTPSGYWNQINATGFSATIQAVYLEGVDPPNPVVPEPATMLIAGLGIAGAAAARRMRKKL